MRRFEIKVLLLSIAIISLVSLVGVSGNHRTSRGRVMAQATSSSAFAALRPVGAATGWGRVVVRDKDLPSGQQRTVQVWLYGMEPRAEYRITIDDVEIGTIKTRSSGSGVLKLQNTGRGHDPVPADLPPVDLLETAIVYDRDSAPTLEGTFSVNGHPGGETTYEEEISLVDVTGGDAAGAAEVEMRDGGHQEFRTHATGLDPQIGYSVIVDGLIVAKVTADDQGQARLQLEHPDDENPLPPELVPVSKIGTVEWWISGGDLLLSGSFTGASRCERFTGTVTEVTEDGFSIETETGSITVVTDGDTEWDDFGDHELAVGDKVKVAGCWDGDVFVADKVELKDGGDEEICTKLVGTVAEVSESGFAIESDAGFVTVVTTDDTEWDDFDDRALAIGDKVKVEGCWDGEFFIAHKVELKDANGEESCFKLVGVIGNVSGENFVLDTDEGSIPVVTTDDTKWDDFGDHDLAIGDKVKVKGCWDGDIFVAREVKLLNHDEEEDCTKYVGNVTEGDDRRFTLGNGARSIMVVTTGETMWLEFEGHELAIGDKVKVDGCWEGEVFVAKSVELKKPA